MSRAASTPSNNFHLADAAVAAADASYVLYSTGILSNDGNDASLVTFDNLTLNNNLHVVGDFLVDGSMTKIFSSRLDISDGLIELATSNPSDNIDIGFYGRYTDMTTQEALYTGLYREKADGDFKLFKGLEVQPSNIGVTSSFDIAQLHADVSAGTIRISDNLFFGGVAITLTDIATNTAQITTNTTQIATNTLSISTNTANIATNAATMVTAVAAATAADLVHTAAIATNATNITTNATNITTNETDIATNTTDITTNATNITTNATNITTNTADIATNTAAIATNETNISTNETDIATNTTQIATNTLSISTNTANITTNATNIATNTADIATNATAIATNETNITTNATNISTNATNISTNETDIATNTTDITTNATNITTNATNITTNTADIATNTAAIATNATDIFDLSAAHYGLLTGTGLVAANAAAAAAATTTAHAALLKANAVESEIGFITQPTPDIGAVGELIFATWQNPTSTDYHDLHIKTPGAKLIVSGDLSMNGNITAEGDITAFYDSSDKRLKTNIETIDNALSIIDNLRGVRFDWNENALKLNNNVDLNKRELGVIAQEIEKELPEVIKEGLGGYMAVRYEKITPVLIAAIKEQQIMIKQQDERISKLENSQK